MRFGDILRALVEERNISQKELAADLNMAASTLGNYIRNVREPDFDTLKLFASYFSVSTDYLLWHEPSSSPTASPAEQDLLRIFRLLPADQQSLFIEQGKLLLRFSSKRTDSPGGR